MLTQIAVVQHSAGIDVEQNLSTLETLTTQAANEGAKIICWAEAFAYLGRHEGKLEILEHLPEGGPILKRCQSLAKKLGVELLLGGFHEADPTDPSRCFNTSLYLSDQGEIVNIYRKIHLFDVDITNGPRLMESKHTSGGNLAVAAESAIGKLGLTICYDLRFPNLYQKLTDLGCSAISVPSAFTKTTGQMHWHHLLCARAIETQTYMIAPAQHGQRPTHLQHVVLVPLLATQVDDREDRHQRHDAAHRDVRARHAGTPPGAASQVKGGLESKSPILARSAPPAKKLLLQPACAA